MPRSSQSGAWPPPTSPQRGADRGGARDGRELLSDLLVQGGDLGVDRVDQPQVHRDLGGVDVAEPAGQRLLQLAWLALSR